MVSAAAWRRGGLGAVAACLVILAGCGWHLRGSYNLPPRLQPIAVEGGGVGRFLRADLRGADALAVNTERAASRVEILDQGSHRRVVSVDRNGKANAYVLSYHVRWQLVAAGSGKTDDDDSATSQRMLLAPQTLRDSRDYNYDASAVLSQSEQERAYIKAMRKDLARRILFRLQGVEAGQ